MDAETVVQSQQDDRVDLFGPTRDASHWQAREGTGCAAEPSAVDWQGEYATCPAGKTRSRWTPSRDRGGNPR
jgi:hypothetical protein